MRCGARTSSRMRKRTIPIPQRDNERGVVARMKSPTPDRHPHQKSSAKQAGWMDSNHRYSDSRVHARGQRQPRGILRANFPNAARRVDLSGRNDHLATKDDDIIGHAIGLSNGGNRDLVLCADAGKRVACNDGVNGGSSVRSGGWCGRRHGSDGLGCAGWKWCRRRRVGSPCRTDSAVFVSSGRVINAAGGIRDGGGRLIWSSEGTRRSIVVVRTARGTGNERGGEERGGENADRNHGVSGCLNMAAVLAAPRLKRRKTSSLFK